MAQSYSYGGQIYIEGRDPFPLELMIRIGIQRPTKPEQSPPPEQAPVAEEGEPVVEHEDPFVEPEPAPEPLEFPIHEGAGWYTLSNGEQIRGKAAATKAEGALNG